MTEHRSRISTRKEVIVAVHLNSNGHCLNLMRVIGIERSRMKKTYTDRKEKN